jgi:hypothetical protein
MPINDFSFNRTSGWNDTFVLYNGQNWDAARRFYVEIRTFQENEGDGGIDEGGTFVGEVTMVDPAVNPNEYADPLSMPTVVAPIFPGRISFTVFGQPTIVIENLDPDLEFLQTKVFMGDLEITDQIISAKFDIDAVNDSVEGWIKYTDEVILGIPNVALLRLM